MSETGRLFHSFCTGTDDVAIVWREEGGGRREVKWKGEVRGACKYDPP